MIVTISGLSGSGKSTVAKLLSQQLNYQLFDFGNLLRNTAKEKHLNLADFAEYLNQNPAAEKAMDQKTVEFAKQNNNIILNGRLTAWLMKNNNIPAFKICLMADINKRAGWIAGREKINLEQALKETQKRDEIDHQRLLTNFGLDINDVSIYDTVIKTDDLGIDEIVDILLKEITLRGQNQG